MSGFLFVLAIVLVALSPVLAHLAERGHPAPYDWSLADPDCPSCHGTGWATVRAKNITYASGQCRCMGGGVWAASDVTRLMIDIVGDNPEFAREMLDKAIARIDESRPGGDIVVGASYERGLGGRHFSQVDAR